MTFLSGFFLVNFLPFGIIILAGLLLFFTGRYTRESWYYPLLFIIITLIVISIWRIPLLIDRRYAMPTMVPGIVISTFLLVLLSGILKKLKIPYAIAITRILIIALLIACVAKAMRVQENKDYLHDIAEVINLDCQRYNITENVALLIFGNPGGRLKLDNNVELINIKNRHLNDRVADEEYQLALLKGILNPDVLKAQYPCLYLLSIENSPSRLGNAWKKKYGDNLELIYEYIRAKDHVYFRLYRIFSHQDIIFDSNKNDHFSAEISVATGGNGVKTFTAQQDISIISAEFIPIEENKIYQLSGEFRSVGPERSRIYFGYIPYTESKKFIAIESVNCIRKTETELIKPCKSKDNILYVRNAEKWTSNINNLVAFDIDDTGNYTDLPNFNLSSIGIKKITRNQIELINPCGKSYPTGTKVRIHQSGNTYIYNVATDVLLRTNEWIIYRNLIICPVTVGKTDSITEFYPATKFVKIVILANPGAKNAVLEFKNIKLKSHKLAD